MSDHPHTHCLPTGDLGAILVCAARYAMVEGERGCDVAAICRIVRENARGMPRADLETMRRDLDAYLRGPIQGDPPEVYEQWRALWKFLEGRTP